MTEDQVVIKTRLNKGSITIVRRTNPNYFREADLLIEEAEQGSKLTRKEMIQRSREGNTPEWWELSSPSDSTEELAMQNLGKLNLQQQRQMERALRVYKRGQRSEGVKSQIANSQITRDYKKQQKQAQRESQEMKPRTFSYGYQTHVDHLAGKLGRCKYEIYQTSKYTEFIKPHLTKEQISSLEGAKNAKLAVLADKAYRATGMEVVSPRGTARQTKIYKSDRCEKSPVDNSELIDTRKNFKYTQPRTPAWDIGSHGSHARPEMREMIGPGKYELRRIVDWRYTQPAVELDDFDFF